MGRHDDSDDDPSNDEDTVAVIYTCRKCDGLTLTEDQLDEHREYHRSLRAKKKARAERQRKRGGSTGAPSTAATSDLFIHQNADKPGPKSKKKASQKARLKAAQAKHKEGAAKTMGIRRGSG